MKNISLGFLSSFFMYQIMDFAVFVFGGKIMASDIRCIGVIVTSGNNARPNCLLFYYTCSDDASLINIKRGIEIGQMYSHYSFVVIMFFCVLIRKQGRDCLPVALTKSLQKFSCMS